MKSNLIGKLITAILAIIMTFNIFMLIRIWFLIPPDSFYREKKVEYILPEGFTPEKIKISWNESLPKPSGWVVRYTSSGCIYCEQDVEWERLIPQLERLNYRIILLLPKSSDQLDKELNNME